MILKSFPMTYRRLHMLVWSLLFIGTVLQGQIRAIKPFGKVSALVVGISDYQSDKIPDLEYADRDAEAFAHYLQYETAWKAAPENIVLLTNQGATYGKFLNELRSLVDQTEAKDRLILYFSGHGDVEKVEENLMGYLLFYDVAPTTYASAGACMVNTLNDYLQELVLEKGAEVVLISDACRSGSLAGSSTGGPQATTAALSELFNNTTKMLSCEPDQVSVEGPGWGGGRGLFSYHLVNGLKGLADQDEDRYVDLFELQRYVQDSVRAASNRKQLPVIKGLSSTRLARVDKAVLEELQPEAGPTPDPKDRWLYEAPDTNFLPQLERFEAALSRKQLLFPEEGSANQIYETIGDHPAAQSVRKVMKISLASALQDEAQQALNEYIVSPGRELARRWANAESYSRYPDYLARAAELLGSDNYFYRDLKSREHYFRGVSFRMQYDADSSDSTLLDKAMEAQKSALQLQPIAPHVHNEMGLLHKRRKEYMPAISEFQQSLSLSPKWSLALTNLGSIYHDMEQYAAAEPIFKDAIQLDSTFALSYYNLAKLYEITGRTEEALVQWERTIHFDPKFAEAYYNLALFSVQDPKAEAFILQYIQLRPEDPDGFNLLGYHYFYYAGKPEKAKEVYQSSLLLDPDNFYTVQSLCYIYKYQKDFTTAADLWLAFIARKPDNHNAYFRLAGIYALSGDHDAAIATLRTLLNKDFEEYDDLLGDPDMESLQNLPAFRNLLREYFPDRE